MNDLQRSEHYQTGEYEPLSPQLISCEKETFLFEGQIYYNVRLEWSDGRTYEGDIHVGHITLQKVKHVNFNINECIEAHVLSMCQINIEE